MPSKEEAQSLFLKGVALLNAILVPIAALGIYLVYYGKNNGSTGVLAAGLAVTLLSPLIAYIAAKPLLPRLLRQGRHTHL